MKIGLLNAYHHVKGDQTYQTQYLPLARKYLKSLGDDNEIVSYCVAQNEFPDNVDEADFWVITGSPKSAYDNDEWIINLRNFILKIHEQKKKLLGLCFGHQIIAKSLGGEVISSPKGWGVGVRSFYIKNPQSWMEPREERLSLLYSHKDQVTKLPLGATPFGSSDFCEFEAYFIGNHILSFQGHPEFSPIYARDRMVARKSLLGSKLFSRARKTLKNPTDHQLVGQWVQNFFNS